MWASSIAVGSWNSASVVAAGVAQTYGCFVALEGIDQHGDAFAVAGGCDDGDVLEIGIVAGCGGDELE
jgi:hypothetical protein